MNCGMMLLYAGGGGNVAVEQNTQEKKHTSDSGDDRVREKGEAGGELTTRGVNFVFNCCEEALH